MVLLYYNNWIISGFLLCLLNSEHYLEKRENEKKFDNNEKIINYSNTLNFRLPLQVETYTNNQYGFETRIPTASVTYM